jgi:general secretion pathway protein J
VIHAQRRHICGKRPHGFTLIEILIALVLFGILSGLVFQTFNLQTNYQQRLTLKQQRFADQVKAWQLIENDLSQLVARPTRDIFGSSQAALKLDGSGDIAFTRLSWYAGQLDQGSQVQRVAYKYQPQQKNLWRESWTYPDVVASSPKQSYILLHGVNHISFRVANHVDTMHESWPLPDGALDSLPNLIEVSMTTSDFGTISRYFHIPQGRQ